eukprot:5813182-Pleurochrysis_carterae.AAC.2
MLHRRPVSVRALRQSTRPRSSASPRISAMVARNSFRLPSGQRRRPLTASTWKPSACTASPTSTFAGAAWSPSSASASTVSCAWTWTLLACGAGVPPAALVCAGSMLYDPFDLWGRRHLVGECHHREVFDVDLEVARRVVRRAAPQAHVASRPRPPPGRLRQRLCLIEPRVLALRPRRDQRGEPLESVLGNAPPKPIRLSTITAARSSPSHHRKHWVQTSARCTGQKRYADSASTT